MTHDHATQNHADFRRGAVRLWLIGVAALVFALVLVGGATRLTESGLSIVEWKPVTGALPPMSDAQWQVEFDKYKAIPQYQQINRGMSLDEFKTIFWWEWAHRLLGRVVGAAFLLPFLWFLWRGWIEPGVRGRLWAIFGLGAVQGGVGWWMVASGLAGRTSVSQYRLAFHLTLACLIYAALIWMVRSLAPRATHVDAPPRIRAGAVALAILVLLQIYLGALVAGLDAGLTYNTWPLIDGRLIPSGSELFLLQPAWRNLFENILTVQFNHRMMAYALWAFAIVQAILVVRALPRTRAAQDVIWLAVGVTAQAGLGILTLLHQVPLSLALAHQGLAVVVLTIAVIHAERLAPRRVPAAVALPA